MSSDCETETESAVMARRRAVRLAETIKNVRQKLPRDALAGVSHADLNRGICLRHFHQHAPAVVRKLHGV